MKIKLKKNIKGLFRNETEDPLELTLSRLNNSKIFKYIRIFLLKH